MNINRLINETSPYLLQHAHNPVDWYAWGPEAFEAARKQNKPIFLSVGYSTCYWCHVMERECFEKPEMAQVMNESCINIKVDREERPDVDQLYMLAVQIITRHGGWPMSVFLTPDLRPFYGGTYFPPEDMQGRPGFVSIVRWIAEAFVNRRQEVEGSAQELANILGQLSEPQGAESAMTIDREFLGELVDRSVADYDPALGGFGGAPKFPRETLLELLLTYCSSLTGDLAILPNATERRGKILPMVLHTLDAMAAGGIRDHLGGGFHRYSTDARWLVPHFEIMLYDNAMLAWCYLEAYRQTEEVKYAHIARGILDFVLREMRSDEGAFYTAFDAEVDAREGASYLWTTQQVEEVLGAEDAKVFNHAYGLDLGPNFADPHHGSGKADQNVLFLPRALSEAEERRLGPLRQKLYEARRKRKQPRLDTKIITSWNGLAIRAFAYAGQILQEQRYLDAASKCAGFLLGHHRMADGSLYRTSRDGKAKYAGFLDDYASLIQALLALREATGMDRWKDRASEIAVGMIERFNDREHGGFCFTDAGADDLIVRQKTGADSPLPSGNALAAMAMNELGQPEIARRTIEVLARQIREQAEGMSAMLQAALMYVRQHGSIEVAADPGAPRTPTPQQIAADAVRVRAGFATPTELHVEVNVADPYHIHAHDAAEPYIATTIAPAPDGAPEVATIEYPPGQEKALAFSREKLRVYTARNVLVVRFKEPVPAGTALKLRLTYQACDDESCLPPVTQTLQMRT